MREIKFKVWDTLHNYWSNFDVWEGCPFYKMPKRFKIVEFTGLKDKNGKDIYESDICRVDHKDKRYAPSNELITWDKHEGWCIGCGSTTEVHWSHEVIGNIYQNKELLK